MKITISDYFALAESQDTLAFFNADLTTDTPLYIDPMLIKYSANPEVRELYWRFAVFFQKISARFLDSILFFLIAVGTRCKTIFETKTSLTRE